jgi:hypothetical protein
MSGMDAARRWSRSALFAIACLAAAASAAAQSVDLLVFTPEVIPDTRTEPVLVEAEIASAPTRVTIDFSPAGSAPAVITLRDDGADGDRRANDRTFTARLPVAPILAARTADDVYRVFIGYLNLENGATRTLRGNLFVDLHGGEIGGYPRAVSRAPAGLQRSRFVLDGPADQRTQTGRVLVRPPVERHSTAVTPSVGAP